MEIVGRQIGNIDNEGVRFNGGGIDRIHQNIEMVGVTRFSKIDAGAIIERAIFILFIIRQTGVSLHENRIVPIRSNNRTRHIIADLEPDTPCEFDSGGSIIRTGNRLRFRIGGILRNHHLFGSVDLTVHKHWIR